MRSLIGKGLIVLLVCGLGAIAPAQTTVQPGQIDDPAAAAPTTGVASVPNSSTVPFDSNIAAVQDKPGGLLNKLWIVSMITAAAGSAVDAGTSWGKTEGNPLLASSNGTFGAKGVVFKAGIAGIVLVPQILLRRHRELKTLFISGNFGETAIFAGAAVHNMGIPTAATH